MLLLQCVLLYVSMALACAGFDVALTIFNTSPTTLRQPRLTIYPHGYNTLLFWAPNVKLAMHTEKKNHHCHSVLRKNVRVLKFMNKKALGQNIHGHSAGLCISQS